MEVIKTKSFKIAVNTSGDKDSKNVALLLPGRLDTKGYAHLVSHLECFSNKGFYSVAFDPPGTWDSPGSIDLYTTTNYLKAVYELVEYYGNKSTLLLGHSRGGNVAALASVNSFVTGIVLVMSSYGPPTLPKTMSGDFKVSHRDLPPGNIEAEKSVEFKLPWHYFEDGKTYDTLSVLRNCRKPKLLFSGKKDKFHTPSEVEEIYDSIPGPKALHELDSEHDYRFNPKIIEEVNEITGQFLDDYILK